MLIITNQIRELTEKMDYFEQDVVIGFKNTIDMLSEEIKSFNQEASEFKQLFHKLNERAKIDADIAFDVIDIQDRVIPLDKEIIELNEKLENISSLELLASDKEETQSREYDEYLPSVSDLAIGGTVLALL
ncbi:hypothetical protein [Wolbachia endosymbiont (group B) of Longitarsus flavicornis]|uniref:hypothetical protein n=1 Tax=Wolbachia endosymbiont (group B) of Longitarsus flavicornis TaxID=3066135 RepID=UPI003342259A